MSEYVHLVGAEDVRHAGSQMASAATEMQRAASAIELALERQRLFMDEWLVRFEAALKEPR